ncbi:MAG: hypothetical protein Q8Q18_01670, partial [bacterium]|nr:hypothetical protein [bacterium]
QVGVKYGEFASRLWQGDYWGVAVDFVKFKLGEEWDELVDMATKKVLSEGAQRMLGVFTALKDIGEWTGNKALEIQFNNAIKVGWQTYKDNYESTDLQVMIDIWWIDYGNNAKLNELGDVGVWKNKFAKVYALQNQVKETPVAPEEIAQVQKVIKKTAVVSFFKLKYPGIGENVAEELADAIVNKSGREAIKQIAEKYKAHLDALTATGVKSETVSSSGICEKVDQETELENCLAYVTNIIEQRKKVLSNIITYLQYAHDLERQGLRETIRYWGIESEWENLKKQQERIIEVAYNSWFGNAFKDIEVALSSAEAELQSAKNYYDRNYPSSPAWRNIPDFRRDVTGWWDNELYEYYAGGGAQKALEEYEKYFEEVSAADNNTSRFIRIHLAKMNAILRDLESLKSKTDYLNQSFGSAPGVLSYGVRREDLENIRKSAEKIFTKKWNQQIADLQNRIRSGEKSFWFWRSGSWSLEKANETLAGVEENRSAMRVAMESVKKDYADALKRFEEERKQRVEEQKQFEAEEQKRIEEEQKRAEAEKLEKEREEVEQKNWLQKMAEAVKNFMAERRTKKEAAKQKELEERQELEKQGIKTFDVSTEEGRVASEKSFEEAKERMLEEELEKKQKEEADAKKLLEETRKQTEAEQKRLEETKPQQTGDALSGTLNLPDNFNVEYFSNDPDSALFTKEGALLVNPRSENSKYYGTLDFAWSDTYGLMSGVKDIGGILELGPGKLDGLNSVPSTGYKFFTEYTTMSHYYYDKEYIYPKAGYLYGIKTHDGKYAAIEVISVSKTQLQIKWKYQPDGSNKF